MTSANSHDEQVKHIRNYNEPILASFRDSFMNSTLSAKTIKNHVQNMEFFAEYLIYYEPLKTLEQTESSDVISFLDDWFLRKAMWSSVESVKAYFATFKKFFIWMRDTNRMAENIIKIILEELKEEREDIIDNAKSYFGSIYGDQF
jgi:site-specific recombinase XerD